MGGPTVKGIEHMPNRNPIACVAPSRPHISNAMGPKRDIKQPSNNPMAKEISSNIINEGVTGRSIVRAPMLKNDI